MYEAQERPRHGPAESPAMGPLNPGPRLQDVPGTRPSRGSQNPGGWTEPSERLAPDLGPLNPGPRLDEVTNERPPRGSQNPGGDLDDAGI